MERQLRRQIRDPVNVQELAQDLNRIWNSILQAFLFQLVTSMRRRCTAMITQKEDTLAVSLVTLILQAVNFMTS